MAKVNFVQAARKDYPQHGIKKGEPYYWWSFRFGGKRYSKTAPKPSQLTQSEFMSAWLEIGEDLALIDPATFDEATANEYASRLDDLLSDTDSKYNNLPDGLQYSGTGELLEARVQACEEWSDVFNGLDWEDYDPDDWDGTGTLDDARAEWEAERNERNYDEVVGGEPSVE